MTQRAGLLWVCVIVSSVSVWSRSAGAAPVSLPAGFSIPADFREDPSRRRYWDFDQVQYDYLPAGKRDMLHPKVEGHVWRTAVTATTLPANSGDPVIARIASELEKDGWSILRRQGALAAHKVAGGHDLWLSGTGNGGYFGLVLTQVAPPARVLSFPSPLPQGETVTASENLPYALPLPGSRMEASVSDHRSFEVVLPNTHQPFFAVADLTRWYDEPPGVSSYEFVAVYRKALEAAGWDVIRGQVAGDAVVIAHYAKSGRDIWLYTRGDGNKQNINVVDYGAQSKASSLKQQLARDGHVALYGIYFDTGSSVPRPESEATLQNVQQLVMADTGLRLEVQGHTDDTGTADHNAALSDARAASVRQWLTAHGIAASRLASKGYGATRPVADNHTPEGKAKNRRVELVNLAAAAPVAAQAPPPTAARYTPLACAIGPVRGKDHTVLIRNTTGRTLKAETIINFELDWKVAPGNSPGRQDCFATDADLVAGGQISRSLTVDSAVTGPSCSAFLSSARPSAVHDKDGGVFTECDPR